MKNRQCLSMRVQYNEVDQTFKIALWRNQHFIRNYFLGKHAEENTVLTETDLEQGVSVKPEWVMELYRRAQIASSIAKHILTDEEQEEWCEISEQNPVEYAIAVSTLETLFQFDDGIDDWEIDGIQKTERFLSIIIGSMDEREPLDSGVIPPIFQHISPTSAEWEISFIYQE